MAYAEVNAQGFEITTCGRCGGSGSYSFNQVHGSTCYGCGGSGKVFTKRGAAAAAFYRKAQERPFSDLKVGEWFWDDTFGKKAKWLPITELRADQSGSCLLTTGPNGEEVRIYYVYVYTQRGAHGFFPDSMVRSVRNEPHRQELLAAARAYQDTLTAQGKPAKRTK
jgi:hypothetical protein